MELLSKVLLSEQAKDVSFSGALNNMKAHGNISQISRDDTEQRKLWKAMEVCSVLCDSPVSSSLRRVSDSSLRAECATAVQSGFASVSRVCTALCAHRVVPASPSKQPLPREVLPVTGKGVTERPCGGFVFTSFS